MQIAYEYIPVLPGESFLAFRYHFKELTHPYHFHEAAEIAVVYGVDGVLQCSAATTGFASGELFFLAPNIPHRFIGSARNDAGASATVVQFDPGIFGDDFLDLPENRALAQLLEKALQGLVLRHPSPLTQDAVKEIMAAKGSRRFASLLHLLSNLTEEENWSTISGASGLGAAGKKNGDRIRRLQNWLHDHYHEEVDQDHVASYLGLRRTSFCRWLRAATGETFSKVLNDHRVAHARVLLQQTDMPVASVAYEVGFRALSHFYREFEKRHRLPPTAFRAAGSPPVT